MQNNDDKALEKLMDEHLKANGLYRKKIAKDGSCLFRAVAEQVLHCQGQHTKVRAECVKYLRKERELYESFIEGDFEEYVQRLQDPQSWVGQVEISALAVLYKHDFIIYQHPGEPPVNITQNGYPDKVRLCFLNGNHYDSVYPQSFAQNAAMCQSILYELLYERVCHVDRNMLAPSLRAPKGKDEAPEVEECKSSDESDLDEGEDFWSSEATGKMPGVNNRQPNRGRGRGQTRGAGRGYLPFKVQNSLNPAHFRNVEYDVWLRSKRAQQRRDFCMAAGMQYTTGDKCQVRLTNTGRFYSAYIQDVSPDDGPVTVFIEELGDKRIVPLWNLRPPSEDSWCKVSEKGKRHPVTHSNGHTKEWENKGGKKMSRSVSFTPQAPAGSSSGTRVQKQNSWPPQAPSEPQIAGKDGASRKSDPSVGGLSVSPEEEEEHVLLERLQKDENNFPSLEASAQALEGGKRAEKKGPRKKTDTENKEHSQKSAQKAEKGKQLKKASVDQDQRVSPPIKDKSTPSPPSSPTLPAPSAPKATNAAPTVPPAASVSSKKANLPAQSTPVQSQTDPVSSPKPQTTSVQSETALAPSTKPSGPTQTTAPSQTAVLVTKTSTPAQSQTAPVFSTTSVPSHATPAQSQIAPVGISTPTQLQTVPPQSKTATLAQSQSAPSHFTPAKSQIAPAPCVSSPATSTPASVSSQTASIQPPTTPTANSVRIQVSPAFAPSPSQTAPESQVSAPVPNPTPPAAAAAPISHTTLTSSLASSQTTSLPPSLTAPACNSGPAALPSSAHLPTPAPQTVSTPVPTPALSQTTSETSQEPEPSSVPPQASQATSPATVSTPVPSHGTPSSPVSAPEKPAHPTPHSGDLPVASNLTPTPASVPAPSPTDQLATASVPISVHPPHTVTSHAPVSVVLPPQSSSTHAPFPPVGLGAYPAVAPSYPPYTASVPPYPSTSAPVPVAPLPMPTPPPVTSSTPTPPYPYSSETRPYELGVSPVAVPAGVGLASVTDYMSHGPGATPQHAFPPSMSFSSIHDLNQDPLYPGFPRNDKDEAVQPPPYSLNSSGKDLPKDTSVLRFFFNLGLKAFTYQVHPPVSYLAPLTQSYNMQPKITPPPSSSSSYSAPWRPDNTLPRLMQISSAPNHSQMAPPVGTGSGPVSHFEMRGAPPAPLPLEVAGFGGHPHPTPVPMPPRPTGAWPVNPLYAPMYSVPPVGPSMQHPAPLMDQAYPAGVLGHHRLPLLPSSHLMMERGEGDGQRSLTPGLGTPHLMGGDMKPVATPVILPTLELQQVGGASPVVEALSFGSAPGIMGSEPTLLANGNRREGIASIVPAPFMEDWDIEEAEHGDADLRSGRSYYRSSYKQGARRGQEDRGGGGFRGRGSRPRRDYAGRGRQDNQPFYYRGYSGRGRGRAYHQHSNVREAGYAPQTET